METAGGGWTLVGASKGDPPGDHGAGYYDALASLSPDASHSFIWAGLADLPRGAGDDAIRFSCRAWQRAGGGADPFDVDNVFYGAFSSTGTSWYRALVRATLGSGMKLRPPLPSQVPRARAHAVRLGELHVRAVHARHVLVARAAQRAHGRGLRGGRAARQRHVHVGLDRDGGLLR